MLHLNPVLFLLRLKSMIRRSRYVIFLCTEEAFRSAIPATTAWYEYLFHSRSFSVLPLS